jgi:hypothetical protein
MSTQNGTAPRWPPTSFDLFTSKGSYRNALRSPVCVSFCLLLSVTLSICKRKPLKPLLMCDYSHFFAVCWTHKIAVKCLSFSSGTERWKTGFLHISSISLQKIQIGRINLQNGEEIINEKLVLWMFIVNGCTQ